MLNHVVGSRRRVAPVRVVRTSPAAALQPAPTGRSGVRSGEVRHSTCASARGAPPVSRCRAAAREAERGARTRDRRAHAARLAGGPGLWHTVPSRSLCGGQVRRAGGSHARTATRASIGHRSSTFFSRRRRAEPASAVPRPLHSLQTFHGTVHAGKLREPGTACGGCAATSEGPTSARCAGSTRGARQPARHTPRATLSRDPHALTCGAYAASTWLRVQTSRRLPRRRRSSCKLREHGLMEGL